MKKKYKIAAGIILGLALLVLLASVIVSRIISSKVTELLKEQHIENLHLSIESTKFSLFDRSLVFSEIHLGPTDSSMIKLKNNELGKQSLQKLSISRLKLRGIQLSPLLFNKKLKINKIIIDDPLYQQISNGKKQASNTKKEPIEFDSIHLEAIRRFST